MNEYVLKSPWGLSTPAGEVGSTSSRLPGVVNAEDLSNNQKPLVIPKINRSSPATSIIATTQSPIVDVNAINTARETNVNTGQPATSGVGATTTNPTPVVNTTGMDTAQANTNSIYERVRNLFGLKSEAQSQQAQAEQNLGIPQQQKDLADINTEIANQNVALRAEKDAIATRGDIPREAANGLLSNVEAKYGRTLADLAIRQAAANGNITALQSAADRQTALKLAPIENELAYFKDFGIKNAENLTQAEKDKLALIISEKDKQATILKDNETAKANILLEAMKNGVSIPDSIIAQINQAPDASTALGILAQNGITLENAVDKAYKQAQIDNLNSQIIERNSSPTGVVTLTGKPQTASQSSANGYADRLNESNLIIDNIGGKFTGTFDIGGSLPNAFQSGERQSYEQAKRNFVTAVLRRESGAAISPTEFDTEAKKYFPQAGDKPEIVIQKSIARNTAINNVYREANVTRPVLPGQIIESDGVKYRVASDGETLEKI